MGEWRIDELAQRAGVAVDTIRYYQREGLLPAGERSGRSMRYSPSHLERLERIRALQSRRFSLAAIQALLDHDIGPTSLETLLAGREGASYGLDELVTAAGVTADFVRGLEQARLLRRPHEVGLDSYDADDVDMLRSFEDLRSLGVPENVLFELARILNDAIESMQRLTAAVFHGDLGPDWGEGIREQFAQGTVNASARVVRDMRAIADYVQHRNIQHIVLRELGAPAIREEPDAEVLEP